MGGHPVSEEVGAAGEVGGELDVEGFKAPPLPAKSSFSFCVLLKTYESSFSALLSLSNAEAMLRRSSSANAEEQGPEGKIMGLPPLSPFLSFQQSVTFYLSPPSAYRTRDLPNLYYSPHPYRLLSTACFSHVREPGCGLLCRSVCDFSADGCESISR